MKLRQKLAMVLAAAMIVTAVPVTTMAASTNKYSDTIKVAINDYLDVTTDLSLNIKLEDEDTFGKGTGENFKEQSIYITASDFAFRYNGEGVEEEISLAGKTLYVGKDGKVTAEDTDTSIFKMHFTSETRATVTALEEITNDTTIQVPVMGQVTGAVPTISVDGEGTKIDSGKYPIMSGDQVATDKKFAATVGEAKNISIDGVGTIADITIEETTAGKLNNEEITIELDNTDLAFDHEVGVLADVHVEGIRGLSNIKGANVEVVKVEDEAITLKFVNLPTDARGAVVIKGLKVKSSSREDVSTGDVIATITAKDNETMNLVEEKVAVVSEYGVRLEVKDNEAVEYIAGGKAKNVEFTIKELASGSLSQKDRIYFTVEGADVIKVGNQTVGEENITVKVGPEGNLNELTYDVKNKEFMLDLSNVNEDAISNHTISLTLAAQPDSTEDIIVKAESKAFDDQELVIGTVALDREIQVNKANVEVGIKGQTGGSISIAEKEGRTFKKGDVLYFEVEEEALEEGVRIKDFDVTGTEGLGVEKVKTDERNKLGIRITKETKEAGEIIIDNIVIDTNNTTPNGTYKVTLTGELISQENGKLEKEFIQVGEEFVNSEASFKMGEKSFTYNGEEVEMDVAPFISAKNRAMIPLRFVSQAFGIAPQNIKFDQPTGTVTIFRNGDVIQLVNGQAAVLINGVKVPMEEAMTIKDDRAFLPMGELARILDVEVEWLEETKTVVFKN